MADINALYDEAHNLKEQGDLEAAVGKLREALAVDETHALSHSALAVNLQRLGQYEDAIRHARATLSAAETSNSFVRTFAYASGAGYGLLLDALSPGWHRKITGESDLGQLLSAAAGVTAAPDAATATERYDGASVRAAEEKRDREQQAIITELRRRFVDGPVLVVPRANVELIEETE